MELKKQLFKLGLLFYLEQRLRHPVVGAVIDEGLITWNHLKKQVRVPPAYHLHYRVGRGAEDSPIRTSLPRKRKWP